MGLFVHEKNFGKAPGLAGWFGSKKESQFDMDHAMDPAIDAGAYQIGTPHVLSLAPVIGALELFEEAGIARIREKSLQLTTLYVGINSARTGRLWIYNWKSTDDETRGGHIYC